MIHIHVTKKDLIRQAKDLPIGDICLHHLRTPSIEIENADKVTLTIDDETRILKCRWFSPGGHL